MEAGHWEAKGSGSASNVFMIFYHHPCFFVIREAEWGTRTALGNREVEAWIAEHCLEDGCSPWYQDSLLLLYLEVLLKERTSFQELWIFLIVCSSHQLGSPSRCIFISSCASPFAFCGDHSTLCFLVNVPDLSQAAFQTASEFQHGAPLQQTGSVFSKGSARIMVALKNEIIPKILKKKNEYFFLAS